MSRIVRLTHLLRLALIAVLALTSVACAEAAASFDPSGPCVVDGRAPGGYPDLEARIPTTFEGQAPESLDSGRNCTAQNLGNLAEAGIDELRFAGGTWSFGGRRSAAIVVFEAAGLDAREMAQFYQDSAELAERTEVTATAQTTLAGRTGYRIDATTGERLQTVLVWPSATPGRVHVVITTDLPDPKLLAAVDALEAAAR